MAIKSDRWIKKMALEHRMIEPFEDRQVRAGVVSYGLSSYGYDIRVADEFKVFTNVNNALIDPKNFDPRSFVDIKADTCIVPPNIEAKAQVLAQASQKLGEKMYADQQAKAGAAGEPGPGEAPKKDENVVDAEFTEVKDKKTG